MSQTPKQIAEEVLVNTTVGMVGSWIISFTVILYVESAFIASSLTVVLCTLWSLLRNYTVRHHYNRKYSRPTSTPPHPTEQE